MGKQHALDRTTLRALMQQRDAPGLIRMTVQLIWFVGSLYAAYEGVANDLLVLQWIALISAGAALCTFFPPLHEAGHKTAFKSSWLNEVVVWFCAIMMLQAPSFFREFHWQHHRKTQDTEHDPEIAGAPDLLGQWPSNPIVYLVLASGQLLWAGKLMFTVFCALVPFGALWEKAFPFISPKKRRRVAWESRLVLLILGLGGWLGWTMIPGFAYLLLVWPISHVFLGFYLMPEHTGLPHDGTQIHKTRTIKSNALVRWLMWNMPLHAEHHAYPAIPFHAVPETHTLLKPSLEHVSSGYLSFHWQALKHSLGLGTSET